MTTSANASSASAPSANADRLARRYGTRPAPRSGRDHGDGSGSRSGLGRRAAWLGSAAVAVVITTIVVLLNVTGDDAVATAQVVSYEVTSPEQTVVQLAVTRPDPSVVVTCSVEAIDASLAQVGARVVEVPSARLADDDAHGRDRHLRPGRAGPCPGERLLPRGQQLRAHDPWCATSTQTAARRLR
ncbi:DUF4307 domain-containing protein [Salana multivorans]